MSTCELNLRLSLRSGLANWTAGRTVRSGRPARRRPIAARSMMFALAGVFSWGVIGAPAVWGQAAGSPDAGPDVRLPTATQWLGEEALRVRDWDSLVELVGEIASQPYRAEPELPPSLAALDYDGYRQIQFDHDESVWDSKTEPFWLEFFHRGFVQRDRVDVYAIQPPGAKKDIAGEQVAGKPGTAGNGHAGNVNTESGNTENGYSKNVAGAESDRNRQPRSAGPPRSAENKPVAANQHASDPIEVRRIDYDRTMFRYGGETASLEFPDDIGFAGLRVAGRLQPGGDPREWLTFLGSSYFRASTARTVYGTSARGLALDIGMNREEEFPDFRAFWVRKSEWQRPRLTVLAWMDSPSVAGAYRFEFDPGVAASHLKVRCRLFFRRSPGKLAVAPLTSMWIWGDGLKGPPKDDRPAVHDADGLLVLADGRQRWRPLARLPYPSVSSIPVRRLQGFGLLQRNRQWEDYLDSNARYHQRPSVWVQPIGDWGNGRVELLELPGAHEGIDNIGAYFVPDRDVTPSDVIQLSYQVTFFSDTRGSASLDSLATCRKMSVERADEEVRLTLDFHPPGMNRYRGSERGRWEPMTRESVESEAPGQKPVQAPVGQDNRAPDRPVESLAGESLVTESTAAGDGEPTDVTLRVQTIRAEVLETTVESRAESGYRVVLRLRPTEPAPFEIECELVDATGRVISETFQSLCPREQPTFIYPAVYTRQE